jgi:hypothetical protein
MASRAFGDDPQPLIRVDFVAAQNAESFLHTQFVFLAVVRREFSPIAGDVALEEHCRTLTAFFESGERSRCGDQLPEVKQGFRSVCCIGISPVFDLGFASQAPRSGA